MLRFFAEVVLAMPFGWSVINQIAVNHLRSGSFVFWKIVPTFMLKCQTPLAPVTGTLRHRWVAPSIHAGLFLARSDGLLDVEPAQPA